MDCLYHISESGDNDLPPETEDSNEFGLTEISRDQVVDNHLIVNTFRGIMHTTKSTIYGEHNREPQCVENPIRDPSEYSNDERIIHSGTSQCYEEVSRSDSSFLLHRYNIHSMQMKI